MYGIVENNAARAVNSKASKEQYIYFNNVEDIALDIFHQITNTFKVDITITDIIW